MVAMIQSLVVQIVVYYYYSTSMGSEKHIYIIISDIGKLKQETLTRILEENTVHKHFE